MAKDRGEEWKEYDKAVHWMTVAFFICLGLSIVLFIFAPPLSYLVAHGISKSSFAVVDKFLKLIVSNPDHIFQIYSRWFKQVFNYSGPFALSMWIPALPFLTIPVGLVITSKGPPAWPSCAISNKWLYWDLTDFAKLSVSSTVNS